MLECWTGAVGMDLDFQELVRFSGRSRLPTQIKRSIARAIGSSHVDSTMDTRQCLTMDRHFLPCSTRLYTPHRYSRLTPLRG